MFLGDRSSSFRLPGALWLDHQGGRMAMPARSKRDKEAQGEAEEPSRKPSRRAAAEWLVGEEDAFGLWLRQSLHEAFDAAVAEPIPDDILRLIEEDRAERERLRGRRTAKPDK